MQANPISHRVYLFISDFKMQQRGRQQANRKLFLCNCTCSISNQTVFLLKGRSPCACVSKFKFICIFGYNLSNFQETYTWQQETPNRLIPIFPITFTPTRPILRISSFWRPSWISRWPPFLKFSQISTKKWTDYAYTEYIGITQHIRTQNHSI